MNGMERHTNDNDTWQPLSLATGRLLASVGKQQDEDGSVKPDPKPGDEDQRSDEERYVAQRLRDLERFEMMVRGYVRPRKKN
jgi:hypothetical protein